MGEDTAFEVFAKCLADVGAGCVVITLTVKLAGVAASPNMLNFSRFENAQSFHPKFIAEAVVTM